MQEIYSSLSCNLDANILLASIPLFEQEKIEAIEWSFDALYKHDQIPSWFADLVSEYARNNRLVGHGIYFSVFSGKWLPQQQQWLNKLAKFSKDFQFDHISEHFGFMTGADFHKGAPISIPFTPNIVELGADRLARIQDVCQCPVGLENLAFAYSFEEVRMQGDFLAQLTDRINGFLILDLHNLYCQLHNFNITSEDLLKAYPLERVREIHISGGSWEQGVTSDRLIRRDTHDGAVPQEVFELLNEVIPLCSNLKFVVLEQLGIALTSDQSRMQFQDDFDQMDVIVKSHSNLRNTAPVNNFLPVFHPAITSPPKEDLQLYLQQQELSKILENAKSLQHAQKLLQESSLRHSAWHIEEWSADMLQTAIAIAQKWKNGF
ncbi:MAG TPA: DUF692 family protein [Dyadobacter sp.]|jgi:uncharacterized protein (UPF0276 family)|nr:DUF692 family protein [Dyadobacter sp.]